MKSSSSSNPSYPQCPDDFEARLREAVTRQVPPKVLEFIKELYPTYPCQLVKDWNNARWRLFGKYVDAINSRLEADGKALLPMLPDQRPRRRGRHTTAQAGRPEKNVDEPQSASESAIVKQVSSIMPSWVGRRSEEMKDRVEESDEFNGTMNDADDLINNALVEDDHDHEDVQEEKPLVDDDQLDLVMPTNFTLVIDLAKEVRPPASGILSRTLYYDDRIKAVIFGFGQGEELSEHTASMPAILHFLQGKAKLMIDDDTVEASTGTWVHIPKGVRHSIQAHIPVVMLLLLLK